MRFFFKPRPGVIGDTIPFYSNGRHHVFYLRDNRDRDAEGIGSAWNHISTTDFVNFRDHGVALEKGAIDEQDHTVATGCVFTDDAGKHHIFYTGINPYLRTPETREQGLMHATSDDLDTWVKDPEFLNFADEARYERHDWRDPFVFKHPETGKFNMIVAARDKTGGASRRGLTALLVSDDLQRWTIDEPFYAPARYHGHECPDWFKVGDWYYLVFSEYTTHTATRYVMSRSPSGPWHAPDDNQFDNRAFYAAKTSSDGDRRFIYGWNPSKIGDSDNAEWQWGGCLTVHEILQQPDGRLVVRMPPEQRDAFTASEPLVFQQTEAGWSSAGGSHQAHVPHRMSTAVGPKMPETFLLEADIIIDSADGTAGLLLHMDDAGDTGYFLKLNLAEQKLQFGKVGGYRNWYVDHMPELDRPLAFESGQKMSVRVVADKSALVAYVNDRVALSARMYSNPVGRCGAFADGAVARFENLGWATIKP